MLVTKCTFPVLDQDAFIVHCKQPAEMLHLVSVRKILQLITNSVDKFHVLYKIFSQFLLPIIPKKTVWISVNQVNLHEQKNTSIVVGYNTVNPYL